MAQLHAGDIDLAPDAMYQQVVKRGSPA